MQVQCPSSADQTHSARNGLVATQSELLPHSSAAVWQYQPTTHVQPADPADNEQ
jgi:hypothetical protein